jgi:hypothetical protein
MLWRRGFAVLDKDWSVYAGEEQHSRVDCILEKFGDELCGSFESNSLANGGLLRGCHCSG